MDFNPRSPCGERPIAVPSTCTKFAFQSTLPVWGATRPKYWWYHYVKISIHAPRVGSDWGLPKASPAYSISIHAPRVGSDDFSEKGFREKRYFNPRSPCGERLILMSCTNPNLIFQSTLPVWGATRYGLYSGGNKQFQSTLPVWGATVDLHYSDPAKLKDFNPRSPCGERPEAIHASRAPVIFQSTLPVWGATLSATI